MKKTNPKILLLLITLVLLTGCGESKEEIEKSKNPEKYVTDRFQNFYKKEIVIKTTKDIEVEKDITKIMEVTLKEDETFTFTACAYWALLTPMPNKYYTTVNNYENVYNAKFLKEKLNDTFGNLTTDTKYNKYNEACNLEKEIVTLELEDITMQENLVDKLVEIANEKEIYAVDLTIKYLDKSVSLTINDRTTKEDILSNLTKLTEETK